MRVSDETRVGSNAKVLRPLMETEAPPALPTEGVGLSCGRLRRSSLLSRVRALMRCARYTGRPLESSPRCVSASRSRRGFERERWPDQLGPDHRSVALNGGGGSRTHEGFRPPVFKFAATSCLELPLVASGFRSRVFRPVAPHRFASGCISLTPSVGKTLARRGLPPIPEYELDQSLPDDFDSSLPDLLDD
jgi:hypothetical protein